jgi:hypothetical protein
MKKYSILILGLLTFSSILICIGESANSIIEEGGLVETTTVLLYGIVIFVILWKKPMESSITNWLSTTGILILMFREMDFDKAFTTMGIFKSRFYKSSEVPIIEKLVAGVVIIFIITVSFLLIRHYIYSIRSEAKKNLNAEWGVFIAITLAAISKLVLDGLPRKLSNIGLESVDIIKNYHEFLEEVLELGIPIALLIALFCKLKDVEQVDAPNALRRR